MYRIHKLYESSRRRHLRLHHVVEATPTSPTPSPPSPACSRLSGRRRDHGRLRGPGQLPQPGPLPGGRRRDLPPARLRPAGGHQRRGVRQRDDARRPALHLRPPEPHEDRHHRPDRRRGRRGIVAAPEAKDIHALLVHCETPLAVSKLDAIKQFGPEENQFFDGTSIQARYLYDLFVESKRMATMAPWWHSDDGSAQREAIRKKAEILAGEDLGGDGDAWWTWPPSGPVPTARETTSPRRWSRPWPPWSWPPGRGRRQEHHPGRHRHHL